MSARTRNLIVVGQGAAGLAAALSVAEQARRSTTPIAITLVDKAAEHEAGGNTLWSPANIRMASIDRVEPNFVRDVFSAMNSRGEKAYFARLAAEAPATVAWLAAQGIDFIQPPYYLAKGPPRIQPVGGGPAIVKALKRAAAQAGVAFRYGCAARQLVTDHERIVGVAIQQADVSETLSADAVLLACGGFQGNGEMMRRQFGPGAETMRLISPGTRFNTGEGIEMALAIGAAREGDWNGMHAEPVDPRAKSPAPVVLVYPYGIVVDRDGRRFFDEGAGLMHDTWEWLARNIHFSQPGATAYAILDSRLFGIANYQRAIRSEVPPARADTLAELAQLMGIDADGLAGTIALYNAACVGDANLFDATCSDGLAANATLKPPKSNWARAINVPPYLAFPLVGAIAYTFGGLATDTAARVLRSGAPLPGLYAAGEITGHYFVAAPNAVSVLRALVFGRIAGHSVVQDLAR